MLFFPFLSFLSMVVGGDGQPVRRVIIQDTVVFRIPVRPAPPMPIEWSESKGPKCLTTASIIGASLQPGGEVDFLLTGRRRVRAEFERDCPAIDFYRGFYVEPRDQRLCARRDTLRSRMGGTCEIRRFRSLTPHPKR